MDVNCTINYFFPHFFLPFHSRRRNCLQASTCLITTRSNMNVEMVSVEGVEEEGVEDNTASQHLCNNYNNNNNNNNRSLVGEQSPMIISTIPTHSKDEVMSEIGNGLSQLPLPLKTSRSCSCCWPRIGPFYRQILMNFMACLGSIAIGTIYAYPAVALARWEDANLKYTTAQTTWFACSPIVVSTVLSVVAGVVVERFGVRLCLVVGTLVLGVSWVMIAQETPFVVIITARVFQGVVYSVYLVGLTVYSAEISEVRWRGIMITIADAMVMLGVFLTYLGGLVLFPKPLAYTLAGVLVPQLILIFFLRESPLWLARRGREDDIVDSLMCLRGRGVDIRSELEHIKTSVYSEKIHRLTAAEQLLLLRKPIYLKPLTLCVLILLFKELTGQYAALTYTVKMFRMAGSSLDPYLCAVVMGAARFLPYSMSCVLIERLPRRLLLSTGMTVAGVSLATLGIFLYVWTGPSKDIGPYAGWVPLACLSVYIIAYSIGVGPISWTLVGELLPSHVRNIGAGIANACFSLFLILVGMTFPYIVEAVGVGGVFIAYAMCSVCGVIFVLTCLPETRGRSFTDIQNNLTHQENVA